MKRLYELRLSSHWPSIHFVFMQFSFLLPSSPSTAALHSMNKTPCTEFILCQSILNLYFPLVSHVRPQLCSCDAFSFLWCCDGAHERDSKVNGLEDFSSRECVNIVWLSRCHSIHFCLSLVLTFAFPFCLLFVIIGICLCRYTRAKRHEHEHEHEHHMFTENIDTFRSLLLSWPLLTASSPTYISIPYHKFKIEKEREKKHA